MNKILYTFARVLRQMGVHFHEENDSRVKAMREAIFKLGSIQFSIDVFPDGSWAAESTNIDGIITGGTNKDHINENLKDAVFTCFEIPPYLCNDTLVKTQDEPLRLEQRMYA